MRRNDEKKEVTHHRAPANTAQVVEETLGMVDGWLEMSLGKQPLPVEVLTPQ